MALLQRSNDRWLDDAGIWNAWVFRGVGDSSFELTPTAWRASASNSPIFRVALAMAENIAPHYSKMLPWANADRVKQVVVSTLFEWQCVWHFASIADELGFRIPGGRPSFDMWEDIFPHNGAYDMEIHPCWGLARHHQMPSRLLDWSNDPLVAAYMATADENSTADIAVFALRRNIPADSNLCFYHVERCDMGYLHRQDGLFTYFDNANRYFVNNGKWPQLEQAVGDGNLIRITLPRTHVARLRRKLWLEKYSKAHMMPTFDNIVESVNGLWARTLHDLADALRSKAP